MQGVKQVILLDDQRLQWETEFTGKSNEWYATITDLTPDQRIVWESEDGDYVGPKTESEVLLTCKRGNMSHELSARLNL